MTQGSQSSNDKHDAHDEAHEPRWLRLAATFRAAPDAATLAHVHDRLAARATSPAWVRWLSRPVALAASTALLVVSAFTGGALLAAGNPVTPSEAGSSMVSTLLGDDGSYGLSLEADTPAGATSADSEVVAP